MNLTRTVLATALLASAGIATVGFAVGATDPAVPPAPAVPVIAAAAAGPTALPGDAPPGEIGRDEAVAAALAHVGGGDVGNVEREIEHGVRVWDVDVHHGGVEHDVDVDAATGTVLRTDRDDDDDDGRLDDHDDDRGDDRGDDRRDDRDDD